MLVSILIPCYNSAKYVSETLDSVLAQTYTNWECVIVDDHSTDNSVEIIKSYCEKYPDKFFLYSNPRKGACAARNFAFEKSKGDYIQYLDADDLLAPQKIEIQLNYIKKYESNDVVLIGKWCKFKNKEDIPSLSAFRPNLNKDVFTPLEWFSLNPLSTVHSWILPRHLIEKVGLWDERLLKNQDGYFLNRLVANAKEVIVTPKANVFYRTGIENSISSSINKDKVHSSYLVCESFENNILNNFDLSKEVKTIIANSYIRYCYIYGNINPCDFKSALSKITFYEGGTVKPFQNKLFKFANKFISTVFLLKIRSILQNNKK